jgi:hypothetical protein
LCRVSGRQKVARRATSGTGQRIVPALKARQNSLCAPSGRERGVGSIPDVARLATFFPRFQREFRSFKRLLKTLKDIFCSALWDNSPRRGKFLPLCTIFRRFLPDDRGGKPENGLELYDYGKSQRENGLSTRVDGLGMYDYGFRTPVDGRRTHVDEHRTPADGLRTPVDGLKTRVDGLGTSVNGLGLRKNGLETREDGRRLHEGGHKSADDGHKLYDYEKSLRDDGLGQLDDGRRRRDDGPGMLDGGRRMNDGERRMLDDGRKQSGDAGKRLLRKALRLSALPRALTFWANQASLLHL